MSENTERGAEGILKFPLPEERDSFLLASNAAELRSVIWELDRRMRNILKHDTTKSVYELAEEIRQDLAPTIAKHAD